LNQSGSWQCGGENGQTFQHGETPIFYAARLRRLATLALLIDAGADPSIPDSLGRDSVAIARERKLPQQIIEQMVVLQQRTLRGCA
jgi:hypothetical protein